MVSDDFIGCNMGTIWFNMVALWLQYGCTMVAIVLQYGCDMVALCCNMVAILLHYVVDNQR
jgi:hypothetical protein